MRAQERAGERLSLGLRLRVGDRQCDVVRRYVCAANGGLEHAPHNTFGALHGGIFTGQ
jgi:hypothetical protein